MIEPITLTIAEACQRHAGANKYTLAQMCQRKALRAVKVGKCWHIPVTELNRVFLGRVKA